MMKVKKICCIFLLLLLLTTTTNLFAITHEKLVMEIAVNNPSLINSRKDIDLAKLDLKDAKAAYQPTVELVIGSLSSMYTTGLGGPDTTYNGLDDTYFNFNLKISQPLYTWDKINTSVDLNKKIMQIQNIQSNNLFKQLKNELETREAAIYYLKEMKTNLVEQEKMTDQLIEIIEESYLNNLVLEQDVLEAKIIAKKIEIGMKELEKEEKSQLSQIIKLTNLKTLTSEDIQYRVDEEKIKNLLKENKNTLIDRATSLSNDNIQTLSILKSVKADETKIAKNSIYWKPDLALQIETSYSGAKFPFVEENYKLKDQGSIDLTIAITSTIWDGGKKLNDIARTKINEEKANVDIIDTKNQIIQNLNNNLYTMELATSNIEYQELNSQIIDKNIENLIQEYNEGYGDKAQVLKAMLEKSSSDLELIQFKLERATSYFTIMYLIN